MSLKEEIIKEIEENVECSVLGSASLLPEDVEDWSEVEYAVKGNDINQMVDIAINATAREYIKIKDHEKIKAAEFLTHPDYKNIVNLWIDKCNKLIEEK